MQERRIAEDKLTTGDLKKLFGVTTLTITNWRKKGLPYFRIGRDTNDQLGHVVFDLGEVLEWANDNNKELKQDPKEFQELEN